MQKFILPQLLILIAAQLSIVACNSGGSSSSSQTPAQNPTVSEMYLKNEFQLVNSTGKIDEAVDYIFIKGQNGRIQIYNKYQETVISFGVSPLMGTATGSCSSDEQSIDSAINATLVESLRKIQLQTPTENTTSSKTIGVKYNRKGYMYFELPETEISTLRLLLINYVNKTNALYSSNSCPELYEK